MTARHSDDLVLAVDGGGAKTDLALLDTSGGLVSLIRGGASHAHYLGVDGSVELIESLLKSALSRAGLVADGRPLADARPLAATAQILLAGADLPEERAALHAKIEQLGWSDRLLVDNDTVALLRAGTERGWGIAVVCGAGINCFGRSADGRTLRFASLGQISGDWGGGGDVGLAALFAAARGVDGRGQRTLLERAVPAHFGLEDPLEVAQALHLRKIPRSRLGELARIVFELSGEDTVAAGIVNRLAEEVIAFARSAIRRLDLEGEDPDVVLGGRLLRALSPSVVEAISRAVTDVAPRAHVVMAASEPIVGAALLGLDTLGADAAATVRARSELDAALLADALQMT